MLECSESPMQKCGGHSLYGMSGESDGKSMASRGKGQRGVMYCVRRWIKAEIDGEEGRNFENRFDEQRTIYKIMSMYRVKQAKFN